MESTADQTKKSIAAQGSDHLDPIQHEQDEIPHSKEQYEHDRRRMEEIRACEQWAMRQYTDYTLTHLVFSQGVDFQKQPEWNDVLNHIHDLENCLAVVWGIDSTFPNHVLVLFGWTEGTSQQQIEDVTVWDDMEHLLKSPPHARRIALNTPDMFSDVCPRLKELIIIRGSDQVLIPHDPLLLFDLETLASRTIPQIGHDPPVEFCGYQQGITASTNSQRTIAILFGWVDEERRHRFIDPKQKSYGVGDNDEYEQRFASKLRRLEGEGAAVESHLCYLHLWYPLPRTVIRKRRCLVM